MSHGLTEDVTMNKQILNSVVLSLFVFFSWALWSFIFSASFIGKGCRNPIYTKFSFPVFRHDLNKLRGYA